MNAVRADSRYWDNKRKSSEVFPVPGLPSRTLKPRFDSMEEMIDCNAALCIRVQNRNSGSGVTPKGDSLNPKCRRKAFFSARARTKADSGIWRSSMGLAAPILITITVACLGTLSQGFNLCGVE